MSDPCDPIQYNRKGLDCFAAGEPETAGVFLKKAYRNLASETGILVNFGLALMQQGLIDQAERAYRLALQSDEQRVRRSAAKNLGFLLLWRGDHRQGWYWHSRRFEGKASKPTNGVAIPSTARSSPSGTTLGWEMPFSLCATRCLYCSEAKGPFRRSGIANSLVSGSSCLAIERGS